jgi:lipopolysaccharide/colanic/teichoic acid biosynthesis glycosyltransferase
MVRNAENRGPAFTAGGDPRITSFGKFLRKYKLDELPQLINVLVGDMAVVGPRPEVAEYVNLYTDKQKKALSVRPGLTDMASIVYSDEESVLARYEDPHKAYIEKIMPDKLRLNLAYIERATFISDLALIVRTIKKVFWRR